MKKMLKSLAAVVFVVAMALIVLGQPAKAAEADDITVYATVEKFSLGQGYLIEPTKLTVEKDALASDVIENLLKENGYEYEVNEAWYQLTYIKGADDGTIDIPNIIQTMAADSWSGTPAPTNESAKETGNATYPDLGNFSYTSAAGWTYYVNNESPSVAMDDYKLQDGDVLRLRFTIHGYGADMGGTWEGCLTLPNQDDAIKALAEYNANKDVCDLNKTYKKAYNKALKAVTDMDKTEEAISAATKNLPTEKKIAKWAKKVEKNTPKKVTLVSAKAAGNKKAKLTWKKVKGASGYEIVYKVKGSKAEFKTLKTIKKVNTLTFTTKKLAKKTYTFKVRAYKTVNGNKIYGEFSKIKNRKVK